MDKELKKLFINMSKTSIVIFVYGLIVRESAIYVAMFLASLISMLSLYMIYRNAHYIISKQNNPAKDTFISYTKRYLIYIVFLWLMVQVDLSWLIAGLLGLLSLKFNIFLKMLSIHLKNIKDKLKERR